MDIDNWYLQEDAGSDLQFEVADYGLKPLRQALSLVLATDFGWDEQDEMEAALTAAEIVAAARGHGSSDLVTEVRAILKRLRVTDKDQANALKAIEGVLKSAIFQGDKSALADLASRLRLAPQKPEVVPRPRKYRAGDVTGFAGNGSDYFYLRVHVADQLIHGLYRSEGGRVAVPKLDRASLVCELKLWSPNAEQMATVQVQSFGKVPVEPELSARQLGSECERRLLSADPWALVTLHDWLRLGAEYIRTKYGSKLYDIEVRPDLRLRCASLIIPECATPVV